MVSPRDSSSVMFSIRMLSADSGATSDSGGICTTEGWVGESLFIIGALLDILFAIPVIFAMNLDIPGEGGPVKLIISGEKRKAASNGHLWFHWTSKRCKHEVL